MMLRAALKRLIVGTPLEPAARFVFGKKARLEFTYSDKYWDERYLRGGNSGAGSYGRLAEFKAKVLNDFVARHGITSVIEFGSGDGNQLTLARYPAYTGVDVSEAAVQACIAHFTQDPTKTFLTMKEYDGRRAELSLSLDVIYHLVEDETYEVYMATLFRASERLVIVYASNTDEQTTTPHVRHRKFTEWVAANRPKFRLIEYIPNRFPFDPENPDNSSFADFYVFEMDQ